jgi:hypothetical protein
MGVEIGPRVSTFAGGPPTRDRPPTDHELTVHQARELAGSRPVDCIGELDLEGVVPAGLRSAGEAARERP